MNVFGAGQGQRKGRRVGVGIGVGLASLAMAVGLAYAVEESSETPLKQPQEAAGRSDTEPAVSPSSSHQSAQLSAPSPGLTVEESEGGPLRISMDFKDANLKNVLKTFSQQTGINVIASSEVADKTITLYIDDVTVMDAMDRILEAADLVYDRPVGSQIYVVKPKPKAGELPPATLTRVYRLKFARVSSSRLARAAAVLIAKTPLEASQGVAGTTSGTSTGSSSTGTTAGGATTGGTAETAVGIDNVISTLLTKDGGVVVDARTNSLIVTDVPDNFPRIEAILKTLDIRTAQVLIEAEVLETSLTKVRDLGVEWGGVSSTPNELISFTPGDKKIRFPYSLFPLGVGYTGSPTAALGTVAASNFKASLQALEKDTDTKVLARPKVLTLDNESALIRLSSQQAVGFSSSAIAQAGTTTSVERMTTGVILVVTPQINEGGYITMLVEPSVTKVVSSSLQPPSSLGSAVFDPKTRSARAMVRIREDDTLVMGGLIDRTDEDIIKRVPILSSIPVLGEVFKDREKNLSASELLVFITPHIVREPEARVASSAGQVPMGLREQEPSGKRQDVIEQQMNKLEREQRM